MLLVASTDGLVNGGTAGLFWTYIWTSVGMALTVLSLAEMASMAPTSSGPYHWVSELAPSEHRRFLSHVTGWMSTVAWQAGAATGPFMIDTMFRSLVEINYGWNGWTTWQDTLLVWCTVLVIAGANCYNGSLPPLLEILIMALHVSDFWL